MNTSKQREHPERPKHPERLSMPAGRRSSERGYILLVLSLFVALLAIGLMQALPTALVQTQREREEELIFRGEQYRRAVQNYVRKFGRYPNSLDDLEDTNGVRFLRRRYQDPITGEEEWRMIHIGPGGTFPDSKNSTAPAGILPADTGLTPSVAGSEPRGFSEQPNLRQPPVSAARLLRPNPRPRPAALLSPARTPGSP